MSKFTCVQHNTKNTTTLPLSNIKFVADLSISIFTPVNTMPPKGSSKSSTTTPEDNTAAGAGSNSPGLGVGDKPRLSENEKKANHIASGTSKCTPGLVSHCISTLPSLSRTEYRLESCPTAPLLILKLCFGPLPYISIEKCLVSPGPLAGCLC